MCLIFKKIIKIHYISIMFCFIMLISCNKSTTILDFNTGFNTVYYNQGIIEKDSLIEFYFLQNYGDYKVVFFDLNGIKTDSTNLNLKIESKGNFNFINKDTLLHISNKNKKVTFSLFNQEGQILDSVVLKKNKNNYFYPIPTAPNHSILDQKSDDLLFSTTNLFNDNYFDSINNLDEYHTAKKNDYFAVRIKNIFNGKNNIQEYGLKGVFNDNTDPNRIHKSISADHKIYKFYKNYNIAASYHSDKITVFDDNFNIQKSAVIIDDHVYNNGVSFIENIVYDKFTDRLAVTVSNLKHELKDQYFKDVEIESSYVKIYTSNFEEIAKIDLDQKKHNPKVIFLIKNKLYVEIQSNVYGHTKYEVFDL